MAQASKESIILDAAQITKILPHRYPILLVDRILELDIEKGLILGQKNVTVNEEFFQGHFPGAPIMPGVLVLEALAQTGGILIYKKGYSEKTAVLLNVNNAKFRKPVLPGDVLYLHVQGIHCSSKAGKIAAKAIVNDTVVVEAEIGFGLIDRSQFFSE
ncbi:MAG: 3-hydroxyacyl-ACP dehydratase FabZ [Simkaniaceae bacterium]